LASAAAVITIAATLVVVGFVLKSQPAPLTRANYPTIPVYYVALNNALSQKSPDQVVVGNTFTRARLATVSPPAHSSFIGVTGAADDRTFVLGAQSWPFSPSFAVEPRTWYLLRIAPGWEHPARLTKLLIPATPSGLEVVGMALSPDGSKLAVALEPNLTMNVGPEQLQIYSVATGALVRAWTGQHDDMAWDTRVGLDNNTTLSWLADGHTLVLDYGAGGRTFGRIFDTNRPGQDLITDSQPTAWSMGWDTCSTPVVTPGGKTVVCPAGESFPEYSTATGKLTRTLIQAGGGTWGAVLWISSSGDTLIEYEDSSAFDLPGPGGSVGVLTQSGFRPLSFPLTSGIPVPDGVAW
jgi:hypothetical protein